MSNHPGIQKQTKETARLGKRIRDRRAKGERWEKICLDLRILKEDGSPNHGLASRIAFDNYEPKGQELRDRLGLRKFCLACKRGFRKVSSGVMSLSPWVLWWRRLDPQERDRRIREIWEDYEKERE